jgi:hypothetical protein
MLSIVSTFVIQASALPDGNGVQFITCTYNVHGQLLVTAEKNMVFPCGPSTVVYEQFFRDVTVYNPADNFSWAIGGGRINRAC